MSYVCNVYNVMIASPSDVAEEKTIARQVILDWNNIHSFDRKITLLPIDWENNSTPTMGDRAQEIINEQILSNADLLIGIFWTRIGTPTGMSKSGSVEEIEKHIKAGKPAMLYFSSRTIPPHILDYEQHAEVEKLKKEFQKKGLIGEFNSLDNFKQKFQKELSMKINKYKDFFSGYQIPSYDSNLPVSKSVISDEIDTYKVKIDLALKWSNGYRINKGLAQSNDFTKPIEAHEATWVFEIKNSYRLYIKNTSNEPAYNIKFINADELRMEHEQLEPLLHLEPGKSVQIKIAFSQYYHGKGLDADKVSRIPEDVKRKDLILVYETGLKKKVFTHFKLQEGDPLNNYSFESV